MKKKRSSTVEPVFGTLTQFLGMRKVNTRGLDQANKVMHLAAVAYNIKKYLKFTEKRTEVVEKTTQLIDLIKTTLEKLNSWILSPRIFELKLT